MALKIILGDITKMKTTAIVNAANTSLLGGGGVDGAIHRAAGAKLLEECRGLHGCKTGQAKITKGYNLPANYVIHTPGPCYSDGNHQEEALLESCYKSCLNLAIEHKIYDISFPSISTGIYRFPLEKAAEIAIKIIHQYPQMDITMVCFDERTKQAYEKAEFAYNMFHNKVYVEYCNLPMKLAFQNKELTEQIQELIHTQERDFELLKSSNSTFRQMICLDQECKLKPEICKKVLDYMEEQDKRNPYLLTKLYPYLDSNRWTLEMKDISYTKVDIKYGNDWTTCIEKIKMEYNSVQKQFMLCFYPYQEELNYVEELNHVIETISSIHNGQCTVVYTDSKNKLLHMMKSLLFYGTLDLCEFGFISPLHETYRELTKFIDIFDNLDSFGEWVIDKKRKGTREDPIQMPYIIYPKEIMDFIDEIHNFADKYTACDLHQYRNMLEAYGIENPFEEMDISDKEGNCVLAMLMCVVRGERFCDGMILTALKKGKIQTWLQRLQVCENL